MAAAGDCGGDEVERRRKCQTPPPPVGVLPGQRVWWEREANRGVEGGTRHSG